MYNKEKLQQARCNFFLIQRQTNLTKVSNKNNLLLHCCQTCGTIYSVKVCTYKVASKFRDAAFDCGNDLVGLSDFS